MARGLPLQHQALGVQRNTGIDINYLLIWTRYQREVTVNAELRITRTLFSSRVSDANILMRSEKPGKKNISTRYLDKCEGACVGRQDVHRTE